MNLITNNPFRTLGLLAGSKASEQSRQIKRLKQFIEAEQEPDSDYSFPILGDLTRTLDTIKDAESKINLDHDKIIAALFWFYNGNIITDETAFDFLSEKNMKEATSIWTKLTATADVTERNSSAFQNLSTLLIHNAFDNYKINEKLLELGIFLKLQFLESGFVENFIKISTDQTYKTTNTALQFLFLNQLQSEIERAKDFSIEDFIKIINKQSFSAKEEFSKNFVKKPIEEIEKKIAEIKTKRKADKIKSLDFGNELFIATQKDLLQIKVALGKSNISFITISDKLANEISQCSTDLFNHFHETETEVADMCLDLVRKAKSIAIGQIVVERINEGIPIIEKYINNKPERDLIYKCNFCLINLPELNYIVSRTVYKETSRSHYNNQRRVEFSQLEIKIPRCGTCKYLHNSSSNVYITYLIGISLLCITIGSLIEENFIIGGLIGAFTGHIMGNHFVSKFNQKNKINGESDSDLKTNPTLIYYFKNGWSFNKPTA